MGARELFDRIVAEGWAGIERMKQNAEPETAHLEFKCAGKGGPPLGESDRFHISRTASGFANTEGGVLIFGIKTGRDGAPDFDYAKELPKVSRLSAFRDLVSKMMIDACTPAVVGFEVVAVENPAEKDVGVVAIFVPESETAVHRATQGKAQDKYYVRTAAGTAPMPHGLLAALFGRRPAPVLRLRVARHGPNQFELSVENIGRGAAHSVFLRYDVFNPMGQAIHFESIGADGWQRRWSKVRDHTTPGFFRAAIDVPIFALDRVVATTVMLPNAPVSDAIRLVGRIDCEEGMPVEFDTAFPQRDVRVPD